MKSYNISFDYKGFKHEFIVQPPDDQSDWWTAFTSNGIEFDVNYDVDYNYIVVYEVIDGVSQTQHTVHKLHI